MQIKRILRNIFFTLILLFLGLSFFIRPHKNTDKSTSYNQELVTDNKYGFYLSSVRADLVNDFTNFNKLYDIAMVQNKKDFLEKAYLIYMLEQQNDKAIKSATDDLKRDPSLVTTAIYLSYESFKKGDYKKAYEILNNIKDRNNTFIVKLIKSWILVALNKNEEAMDLLETEIDNQAFSKIVLMNLGLIAAQSGQYEYAEELFTEVQKNHLSVFDIEIIANYYLSRDQKQKAIQSLENSYKKMSNSISLYEILNQIKENKYQPNPIDNASKGLAFTYFDLSNIIVSLFPQSSDLHLMYLEMSLNLEPNLYIATLMKGEVYKKLGNLDKYNKYRKSIPEEHPLSLINKFEYATFLLDNEKNVSEGIDILKGVLVSHPSLLQIYQLLGDYYKKIDNNQTAIDYYTKGIEKEGNDRQISNLYFSRAMIYDKLNEKQKAERDLEKAFLLFSKNPVLLNYYGYFLITNNQKLDQGFNLIEQAIGTDPLNSYYLDSYGWAFFKLGKSQDAIKMLQYAKSLEPTNPVILDHLGDIYWDQGRKREAMFEWTKALNNLTQDNGEYELTRPQLQSKIANGI